MRLKRLELENFRGYRGRVSIDLDEKTVFIGENNCGKSSILEAVKLALSPQGAGRRGPFGEYDHHLPSGTATPADAGMLKILLEFREDEEGEWDDDVAATLSEAVQIGADDLSFIRLRMSRSFDAAQSDFATSWAFLDANDNELPGARSPRLLRDLQQLCPVFHLAAVRDAAQEFKPRSTLWSSFLRSPTALTAEERTELETQLSEINERVLQAHAPLGQVRTHLSQAGELIGRVANGISIEALPARVFEILGRSEVRLQTSSGARLPLACHGSGAQSLSVLFLFQAFLSTQLAGTYSEHAEPILALEEPEAHLHPSATRALWGTIEGLAGQVLLATHSGDLVSSVPLSCIRRLARTGGGIATFRLQPNTLDPDELRQVSYHVHAKRGALLFARCWLLVEGETEYTLLTELADILGYDLDREGVSIVEYRQARLAPFAKLANDLGIQWLSLIDGDARNGPDHQAARAALAGRPEAQHVAVLPADNMELYACTSGFGQLFVAHIAPQKQAQVVSPPGSPAYWREVTQARERAFSKPRAALAIANEIRQGNQPAPPFLQTLLQSAVQLAGA